MSIYADFAGFVEENGELVESTTSLFGEKMFYSYKDYFIVLDLGKAPDKEKSRVVCVLKDGKAVYVSEYFIKGYATIFGKQIDLKFSDPKILSELLEEWRD